MIVKKFRLVIWRNLRIHRRFWLLTLLEILIPIILFVVAALSRARLTGLSKTRISEATYYESQAEETLCQPIKNGSMKIWYAPNSESAEQIIKRIQETFLIADSDIMRFESEDKLLQYYNNYNVNHILTIAAVIFNEKNSKELDYDLRFYKNNLEWNTKRLYTSLFAENQLDRGTSKYVDTGFVGMQIAINKAFIQRELKTHDLNATISLQQFPDPPRVVDSNNKTFTTRLLPLITIFSYIFLSLTILQNLVTEKSSGFRSLMKRVGLEDWMFWLGWFSHYFVPNLTSIGVLVIVLKVPFGTTEYAPIEYCDWGILVVFLSLYLMATITFCFMISTLFSKSFSAIFASISISFFSYFMSSAFLNDSDWVMWIIKIFFGIFPNVALKYGYDAISAYEMREIATHWSNIFQSGSESEKDVTIFHVFMLFIVQNILFALLTIYIDNVNPGKFGFRKLYCFPILNLFSSTKIEFENDSPETERFYSTIDELNLVPCIEIKKLSKKYEKHAALDNINLKLYPNQLILLTGENGVGKTTLLSIISGMISQTSGTIKFHGENVTRHDQGAKIGVCPQKNLMFSYLTVKEHLQFFSILRGKRFDEASKQADDILAQLNLVEARDKFPNVLSVGNKRKLALGMCLTGDTEILILDEPFEGIDTKTRLMFWDMLKKLKEKKTIVLCTHLLNEVADFVDFMFVMSRGRIKWRGTPMKLKQKYGLGYRLLLSFNCDNPDVKNIEKKFNLTLFSRNGNLIAFKPKNFRFNRESLVDLEDKQKEYGICNMEIRLTTLEDVVLKLDAKEDEEKIVNINLDKTLSNFEKPQQQSSNTNKYKILFLKRWYCFKRTYYFYIPETVMALVYFILVIFLLNVHVDFHGEAGPPLSLSLNSYKEPVVYYNMSNSVDSNVAKYFSDLVREQNGKSVLVDNVTESIISRGLENIAFYKKHTILATELKINNQEDLEINCLYSDLALHSAPISVDLAMNSLAKSLLGPEYSIVTRNAPLENVLGVKSSNIDYLEAKTLWLAIVPIGCFLLICDSVIFPTFETLNGFFEMQLSTGISVIIYWLINAAFDIGIYFLKSIIVVPALAIVNVSTYNLFTINELGALYTIVSIYSIATLPFNYLISYKQYKIRGACRLILVNFLFGFSLLNVISVLGNKSYVNVCLEILFPPFALYYMNDNFIENYVKNYNCANHINNNNCSASYFWNNNTNIYLDFFCMVLSFIFYLLLSWLLISVWTRINLSSYIKHYVANSDYVLSVDKIRKNFSSKLAVNEVSFKVKKAECFGVIGPNGAGKTTTLKILSASILPKCGKIFLNTRTEREYTMPKRDYNKYVKYCSNKNVCNHILTIKEHLSIMATLWGHSEPDDVTRKFIYVFGLEKFACKPFNECSGGIKTRLYIALALIGVPKIVLLDEATNGIDTLARRRTWNLVNHFKSRYQTSFILASHNMAECETLCDKIAIIRNGNIQEQGALPDIKNKFQNRFLIRFSLKTDVEVTELKAIHEAIKTCFIDIECKYKPGILRVQSNRIEKLSFLFEFCQKIMSDFTCIKEFTITSTSLMDVVLSTDEDLEDEDNLELTCFDNFCLRVKE